MPIQTADNLYGVAKWIVDPTLGNGTHTTIASALTSASSGDTIFIRPGTYTENITLKAGVNLTSFNSEGSGGQLSNSAQVVILGNCTATFTGTCAINGIQLQTNSGNFLTVSGSNATVVILNNCFLNCNNNTGISYSASNSSSNIQINYCTGNLNTTGIALYSMSSTGNLNFYYCDIENTGVSSTASSNSAGAVACNYCNFPFVFTTSSTGAITSQFGGSFGLNSLNTTALTTAGTGTANMVNCRFQGGSASAVSVGTGTTVTLIQCIIDSTNTNGITGAGTVVLSPPSFSNTGIGVNTTTITDRAFGRSGTFTPTLAVGGSTTGITYSTQVGKYYRIGNLVFVNITLVLTSKGANSGNLTITGLPFTSANDSTQQTFTYAAPSTAFPAGSTQLTASITPNTSAINVFTEGTSQWTSLLAANIANGTNFQMQFFYWTV